MNPMMNQLSAAGYDIQNQIRACLPTPEPTGEVVVSSDGDVIPVVDAPVITFGGFHILTYSRVPLFNHDATVQRLNAEGQRFLIIMEFIVATAEADALLRDPSPAMLSSVPSEFAFLGASETGKRYKRAAAFKFTPQQH